MTTIFFLEKFDHQTLKAWEEVMFYTVGDRELAVRDFYLLNDHGGHLNYRLREISVSKSAYKWVVILATAEGQQGMTN